MKQLCLKRREERRLRAGHLWVFSNEVDSARTPLTLFTPGEAVEVLRDNGQVLGSAYVNPASLICARLVSHRPRTPLDADLLRVRLQQALELRERRFSAPFYRLCHGEGDMLPGLVVDRYGDVLALQIGTAGMDRVRDDVLSVLEDLLHPRAVLLRNDIAARDLEGLPRENSCPVGIAPEELDIPENGVHFTVPFAHGQKTGWFFDQRANHAAAARFARGQAVLDVFCYCGGFGVTAAVAGARSVTFLDASATALDYAGRNLAANAACPGETLHGDALQQLAELRRQGRRFGLICLDPPAFIKRRKDAEQGLEAYRRVNGLALDLLEPGGVLVSCSCSHHLDAAVLRRIIGREATRRHLQSQMLFAGAQDSDHPVHTAMPETAYLKSFGLRFLAE